jgi:ABC-type glycerol-3-phosphate transport system permease component
LLFYGCFAYFAAADRQHPVQQADCPTGACGFFGQYQINWAELLAMTTIAIIPIMVVFSFMQKFFMRGITAGAG